MKKLWSQKQNEAQGAHIIWKYTFCRKKLLCQRSNFDPITIISSLNIKFRVVMSFSFLMELTTIH